MYIVVGLGNPGKEYLNTRHNIGFDMLDVIAAKNNAKIRSVKHKAITGECTIAGEKAILVKPQTYMNLSGESVSSIAAYYKVPPHNIIVIYDEAALTLGKIRIRANGSAAGHNGIKNIIYHLHTDEFVRVRIGIGTPIDKPLADFVLDKLTTDEIKFLTETAKTLPDVIETIVKSGSKAAMNLFN